MKNLPVSIALLLLSFVARATVLPISGTLTLCPGTTTILADATPGGSWTSGSTAIATVGTASGTVTGISAGTADIIYTVGAEYAFATVTVNPPPGSIADGVYTLVLGSPGQYQAIHFVVAK